MKNASQNISIVLTAQNAKCIKKVCKSVNLTPERLINDLLSRLTIIVSVKPKEYEL